MDEKNGKCCAMQSRLMWEEDFLAALLPASSSGSGAEQRVLKIACFSPLIWAASSGSASTRLKKKKKGTQDGFA